MEMVYDGQIERSTGNCWNEMGIQQKVTHCVDYRRDDSETTKMIKNWIEKYIKPELKENTIVYKKDPDGRRGFMHQIYAMAGRFGLNAKILSTNGECIYSFWYPYED